MSGLPQRDTSRASKVTRSGQSPQSLSTDQIDVIDVEEGHLNQVSRAVSHDLIEDDELSSDVEFDEDLLALRDQIQEARAEDRAEAQRQKGAAQGPPR